MNVILSSSLVTEVDFFPVLIDEDCLPSFPMFSIFLFKCLL